MTTKDTHMIGDGDTPKPAPDADLAARLAEGRALLAAGQRGEAFDRAQAILADRPDHGDALFLAIDAVLPDDAAAALALADRAVSACPGRPLSHWKQGAALMALGRADAAIGPLETARKLSGGTSVGVLMALGRARMQTKAFQAAEHAFSDAITVKPDAMPAHRGRSAALRAQGKPRVALELVDAALAEFPNAPALIEERIEVLADLGRFDALIAFADVAFARGDALSARAHLLYGNALRDTGDTARADAAFTAMLDRYPDHLVGHLNRIRLANQTAGEATARRYLEEAHRALPNTPALIEEDAAAATRRGDTDRAIAILASLVRTAPERHSAWAKLGQLHLQRGDTDAGIAHLTEAMARHPDATGHRAALADALRQVGRLTEAMTVCYTTVVDGSGQNLAQIATSSDPRHLCLPDIAFELCMTGDGATALPILADRLLPQLPRYPAARLARLAMLAQGRGMTELAAGCITAIGRAETLTFPPAKTLLELAHGAQDHGLFTTLAEGLGDRLPPAEKARLTLAAIEMRDGARAALAHLREGATAQPPEACAQTRIALMLRAGMTGHAYRYARRCRRAWPNQVALGRLFHDACLQSGRADEAEAALTQLVPNLPAREVAERRFRTVLAKGDVAAAHEMARNAADTDDFPYPFMHAILSSVAMADLETGAKLAETFSARAHRNPAFTHHFRTTHPGSMLNELRLYKASAGGLAPRRDPHLVANFFYPAQAILRDRIRPLRDAASLRQTQTPRHIVQFWDSAEPPVAVAELIDGWAADARFEHRLFSRDSARAWIAALGDRSYQRAFRAAKNAAEEADFFRLLYLYEEGGVYSDADNRLSGDLLQVCDRSHLVLFSETCGGVRNDLILASPRHPIIGRALELCTQALISFEKEITWAKTGPGLLTRATASVVVETPDFDESDLMILPETALRRVVHPAVALPYKSTPAYWNDETGRVPDALKKALSSLVEGPWGRPKGQSAGSNG